jgi:hypothetical protein
MKSSLKEIMIAKVSILSQTRPTSLAMFICISQNQSNPVERIAIIFTKNYLYLAGILNRSNLGRFLLDLDFKFKII